MSISALRHRRPRAFTTLELIVVLIAIGLLAAFAVPTYTRAQKKALDGRVELELNSFARNAVALAAYDGADALGHLHVELAAREISGYALDAGTFADGDAAGTGQWVMVVDDDIAPGGLSYSRVYRQGSYQILSGGRAIAVAMVTPTGRCVFGYSASKAVPVRTHVTSKPVGANCDGGTAAAPSTWDSVEYAEPAEEATADPAPTPTAPAATSTTTTAPTSTTTTSTTTTTAPPDAPTTTAPSTTTTTAPPATTPTTTAAPSTSTTAAPAEADVPGEPQVPAECAGMSFDNVIYGTDGDDVIEGTNGNDLIFGLDGHDTIFGGNGQDCLVGGPGADMLFGQNGKDALVGETGDDLLDGGNGKDWLYGGADNDTLEGANGPDALNGGDGTGDYCDGGRAPENVVECELGPADGTGTGKDE